MPRKACPQGLLSSIDRAVHSASQIRDRFSPDGWLALADLQKTGRNFAARVKPGDDATRAMTVLLRKLAGFSGLVHENMYRFAGWRFLEIGRRLERGIQIAGIVGWLTREGCARRRARNAARNRRQRHDPSPPLRGERRAAERQSTCWCSIRSTRARCCSRSAEIRQQLEMLPGGIVEGQRSPAAKAALHSIPSSSPPTPEDLDTEKLEALGDEIARIAGLIADAYFA